MVDDNLERKEVDLLIKELSTSARRPVAPKPPAAPAAGPAGAVSGTASSFQAAPGPRFRKTFISAISFRPLARKSFLPDISLPDLPLVSGITEPKQVTLVRMCVGLGVALSAAMPYWPYPKACAWWLLLYLLAVAVVVVAGVWTARQTWNLRLGVAHVVAIGIILWGITLAAEETLPRIGYAKAEAVWWCPS